MKTDKSEIDKRKVEWLGQKRIKFDSIHMPPGFPSRKKQDHVHELAESILELGGRPMGLPIVLQLADKRIPVTGRDRLAAMALNGDGTVLVEMIKTDRETAELMEIDENLRRRRGDDYDKLIARRVELTTAKIRAAALAQADAAAKEAKATGKVVEKEPKAPAKRGRPKSEKGQARELVAKAAGKSPEAVRQAEKRAKAPKAPKAPKASEADAATSAFVAAELAKSPFPFVKTWGLVVDDATRDKEKPSLNATIKALDAAGAALDAAMRALAPLKSGGKLEQAAYARVYHLVQNAAGAGRLAYPAAMCPTCKWVTGRRESCNACGGSGFVGKDALEHLPAELQVEGDGAMVPDMKGGYMPIAEARANPPIFTGKADKVPSAAKPAKGKPALRVLVEKTDGTVTDYVPAPEESVFDINADKK